MCGRFTLTSTPEALAERFELSAPLDFSPRFNIAPGQDVVAVRLHERRRQGCFLRWGLVPGWAPDPSVGNRMINARIESAAEKPAFRVALRRRRCVVPASGFYEWSSADQGKQPHHIYREGRALFAMAGLWESWDDPTGNPLESCVLLTQPAHGRVAELHHRMPVVVPDDVLERWLDPAAPDPEALLETVARDAGPAFLLDPVTHRINRPSFDEPSCLEPVAPAPRQPGLFE